MLTYQRIPINKMRTITIDVLNEKAIKLLQDLEELNLIRMFNKNGPLENTTHAKKKASDYKGIISLEIAEKMQEYVKQSKE